MFLFMTPHSLLYVSRPGIFLSLLHPLFGGIPQRGSSTIDRGFRANLILDTNFLSVKTIKELIRSIVSCRKVTPYGKNTIFSASRRSQEGALGPTAHPLPYLSILGLLKLMGNGGVAQKLFL